MTLTQATATPDSLPASARTTFESAFDPRENAFGFLRLLLALGVLVSHCFPLGGLGPEPFKNIPGVGLTLGTVSVYSFFILSGFLITRSAATSRTVFQFLWNRFLRIFPGFWVCLLVTVAVFVPLICLLEGRPLGDFWSAQKAGILSYVHGNFWLRMNQFGIPPLLESAPHRSALNGSLWSLIYEWRCYLFAAIAGYLLWLRPGRLMLLGASLCFWASALLTDLGRPLPRWLPQLSSDPLMRTLGVYFLMGGCAYVFRRRILNSRLLFALSLVAVVLPIRWNLLIVTGPAALTYAMLWLAFNLPKSLTWFDRSGDLSYGFYVYAFPVQQLLSAAGVNQYGFFVYLSASTLLTLGLAWLSYHLVEKHALRAKRIDFSWLVGRRWGPALGRVGLVLESVRLLVLRVGSFPRAAGG